MLPGDEVLVPAYHHGSEVEALLAAGVNPRFYAGDEALAPDEAELERLLAPGVRALYLTHYLGFPQDAARWRTWCDERGLLLIEDAAQAWLSMAGDRPAGAFGDLAIFCLYKTVGVPDGGAMVVRAAPPGPEGARSSGAKGVARRHALWLLQRSGLLAGAAARRPAGEYVAEEDFALGDPGQAPSAATMRLVTRLADEAVAARRRANYSLLLSELESDVPAPFDRIAPGASPFALPIETSDKARLLDRLAAAGVAAIDLWSVPHPALPGDLSPDARRRRERTVALPVHQGLRPADLDRIASVAARPGRPGRPELRLEPVGTFEELAQEWDELAERSQNIFATREWSETWWRHFGGGRRLHMIACRSRDGRLRGILPLYSYARLPLRTLRFLGHGPADQLGPVCAVEDAPAVARALRRAMDELRPDLLIGDYMPRDEGWSALCGGRVLASQGAPVLRFDRPSWDEILRARSANLRQQVGRLERKLQREHGLRYRAGGDGELGSDLELLFSLHAARWSSGRSNFTGPHLRFHRDFAVVAQRRGWLRLWFLDADGRTVAAWHGFRFAGVESYYQAGRDPGWEGPSVGFVLLAHSIRAAFEDGMSEYRFLRGEQPFKYRFANADPGVETIGVACGSIGHAALAGGAALPDALAAPLRRRLGT